MDEKLRRENQLLKAKIANLSISAQPKPKAKSKAKGRPGKGMGQDTLMPFGRYHGTVPKASFPTRLLLARTDFACLLEKNGPGGDSMYNIVWWPQNACTCAWMIKDHENVAQNIRSLPYESGRTADWEHWASGTPHYAIPSTPNAPIGNKFRNIRSWARIRFSEVGTTFRGIMRFLVVQEDMFHRRPAHIANDYRNLPGESKRLPSCQVSGTGCLSAYTTKTKSSNSVGQLPGQCRQAVTEPTSSLHLFSFVSDYKDEWDRPPLMECEGNVELDCRVSPVDLDLTNRGPGNASGVKKSAPVSELQNNVAHVSEASARP